MEETFGVLCGDRKRQGQRRREGEGTRGGKTEVRHVEKDSGDKGRGAPRTGKRKEGERAVRNIVCVKK